MTRTEVAERRAISRRREFTGERDICVWLALLPVVGGAALLVRGEPKVNIHGVALVFAANFLRAVKVFC